MSGIRERVFRSSADDSGETVKSSTEIREGRPALAEQARTRLSEMIVGLELQPGSVWTEHELAAATGFGRTPVREALKRLEADHLVRILRGHGVQITEINVEQQLLLLETRRELERLVASRAAQRRSAAEARDFEDFAKRFDEAGRAGDVLAFIRLHTHAESFAVAASRNRFAAAAIAPCHSLSHRFYVYHHRRARDLQLACEHHARVMRAIASGDPEVASRTADELLDYVEAFTRATLSSSAV